MRILYWAEAFWPYIGGIEVLSAELLPALRDRGHQICVVTSRGEADLPEEDKWRGIAVHRLPFRAALRQGDLESVVACRVRVAAILAEFKPDVKHLDLSGPSAFFGLQAKHDTPWLVVLHSTLPEGAGTPDSIAGRVLGAAGLVVGASEYILSDTIRRVPTIEGKCRRIYNGLELPELSPSEPDFADPVLLCVGRVIEGKGYDVAIDGLAALESRHPELRLRIVGDGTDLSDLWDLAATRGVAERVEFPGWMDPKMIPEEMDRAAIVAMPSRVPETFGLVALQGAQLARPVVASAVGALPEVVVDGETGYLVPPDDPGALAEAVAALLDDPEHAARMGKAGRERAKDRFGFERCVAAYEAAYAELAGSAG